MRGKQHYTERVHFVETSPDQSFWYKLKKVFGVSLGPEWQKPCIFYATLRRAD